MASTSHIIGADTARSIQEIKDFLDENNVSYEQNDRVFKLDTGDGNRGYEIHYIVSEEYPIAYPKYGIEGVPADYFYQKSFEAENNNSFICWVKDYEWNDSRKREVLKSYFLHAVGKTKMNFYARETEVREVSTKEGRAFEAENCFYGKRGASLSLGLYTKKEKYGVPKGTLIMIYTFGKNFFGKDDSIEVLRVGTRRFSNVIGGSSKLLKHFLRNYKTVQMGKSLVDVKKLKFYSDYDHNIGGSMDSLGFEFVSYSQGGFMNLWLETGEVKSREPNRHKIIMEKMKEGKILAIPNAGVKTYVMNVEKDND